MNSEMNVDVKDDPRRGYIYFDTTVKAGETICLFTHEYREGDVAFSQIWCPWQSFKPDILWVIDPSPYLFVAGIRLNGVLYTPKGVYLDARHFATGAPFESRTATHGVGIALIVGSRSGLESRFQAHLVGSVVP